MTASNGLGREVFGFALASSLSDPTFGYPSWNFSLLSTVAFFGLHINWNGSIIADSGWSVWSSSALTGLLSTAHASGTKVVVTIVLQDFAPSTPNMCAGLINRAITVSQTVAQVAAKGVDGVNVDYEGLNGTCQNGQTARSMMTDFVRNLRAALPWTKYLSVDTYASSAADPLGFYDVHGMSAYINSFFVMAYDLEYSNWMRAPLGCTSFCLAPTAPLGGYYYNDANTAAQYVVKVPASKVILGVPYYGRVACVSNVAPNSHPTGLVTAVTYTDASTETSSPDVLTGSYAAHRDARDPSGYERWDTWYNTSLKCVRELYWDDTVSLGAKYDLVNRDGLGGIGIWTLNYGGGAPELWSTLSSRFAACRAVTVGSSPYSPAPVGTAVAINASAVGCPSPNPLYEFWMLRPGSTTWQLARAYSASPSFTWNTSGIPSGSYRFSVFVRDAAGSGLYSNGFGRYDTFNAGGYFTLTSTSCTAVSLSASPAAAAMVGTTISFTAMASGCPNPLYQFWVLNPASGKWLLAHGSGPSTYSWNTTGNAAGTYRFSVLARDAASAGLHRDSFGIYDAFNAGHYSTLTPGCAAAGISAAPSGPVPAGTIVAISSLASGCRNPSPLYAFWVLAPGSTGWQLAQGYSANPAFSWSTAGKAAGTYRFSAWVHDASNSGVYSTTLGRYDAFDAGLYITVTPACSAATVSVSPVSPAKAGVQVTLNSKASVCPHPLFRFWMLSPGSSAWQLAQDYTTSPTFVWQTAGKPTGVYEFCVWARDAGSPGVFGNNLGRYDAFNAGLHFTLS
jgi:spore germination protein YaaH